MILSDPKNTAVETAQFRYEFAGYDHTCLKPVCSLHFGTRQIAPCLLAK